MEELLRASLEPIRTKNGVRFFKVTQYSGKSLADRDWSPPEIFIIDGVYYKVKRESTRLNVKYHAAEHIYAIVDDVYDEETGPDLLGALQKILGYDYNVTDRYKTKQWLELDPLNGWHFARVLYATTDRAYTIEKVDKRYVVVIPNSKRDNEVTIVYKDESGQVRPLTLCIDIIKRYPKKYSMTEEEIKQDAKWACNEDLMVTVEQFVEEF